MGPQRVALGAREERGGLGRIDPRREEGLVRVDVADADDLPLVHQHLLDSLFRRRHDGGKARWSEPGAERFRAKCCIVGGPGLLVEQQNCAQTAHVAVDQLPAIVERGAEDGVLRFVGGKWLGMNDE